MTNSSMDKQAPMSDIQSLYYVFWEYFNAQTAKDALFAKEFDVKSESTIRGYQDFWIACNGFHVVVKLNYKKQRIYAGIYFDNTKEYHYFYQKKEEIEQWLKGSLEWDLQQTKGSALYTVECKELENPNNWPKMSQWMMHYAIKIKSIFLAVIEP